MKLPESFKRIMDIQKHLTKYQAIIQAHGFEYSARLVLLILIASMSYIVLLPSYNFAHLMPRSLMDLMGINYASRLWIEQHSDVFFHFAGAGTLVLLFTFANLFAGTKQAKPALVIVIVLCFAAEIAQSWIGRGFDEYDLLFGISGSFMAYLGVTWLFKRS